MHSFFIPHSFLMFSIVSFIDIIFFGLGGVLMPAVRREFVLAGLKSCFSKTMGSIAPGSADSLATVVQELFELERLIWKGW